MPLSKLQLPFPSNPILQPLEVNLHLPAFLVNLPPPNKQLFKITLLVGLHGEVFNS